jgi:hypothetical protein
MNITTLYAAAFFYLLTPGILFRIPSKSSLLVIAFVHSVIFAAVYYFLNSLTEGFSKPSPAFFKKCINGNICPKITTCSMKGLRCYFPLRGKSCPKKTTFHSGKCFKPSISNK